MAINKPRILYVEDDKDAREVLVLMLERENYDVVATASVERGLKLVEKQKFSLYIIDTRLPDGSGVEICKAIRQIDAETPILFYSAAAHDTDRNLAMDAGAQAYLVKPAQSYELFNTIARLITPAR